MRTLQLRRLLLQMPIHMQLRTLIHMQLQLRRLLLQMRTLLQMLLLLQLKMRRLLLQMPIQLRTLLFDTVADADSHAVADVVFVASVLLFPTLMQLLRLLLQMPIHFLLRQLRTLS
jgi:hypothetical protein